VDQTTREDIAATAAVHRDLGPDYTDAASEAPVERIGSEIDKRMDARLAQHRPVLAEPSVVTMSPAIRYAPSSVAECCVPYEGSGSGKLCCRESLGR
jgi:hypothetical protein